MIGPRSIATRLRHSLTRASPATRRTSIGNSNSMRSPLFQVRSRVTYPSASGVAEPAAPFTEIFTGLLLLATYLYSPPAAGRSPAREGMRSLMPARVVSFADTVILDAPSHGI